MLNHDFVRCSDSTLVEGGGVLLVVKYLSQATFGLAGAIWLASVSERMGGGITSINVF